MQALESLDTYRFVRCTETFPQALHDDDRSDNPKVNYWTKEEVKEFCSLVEVLDTSTYAYLKNVGTQAFSVEKFVQFAEKRKIPGNLLKDTLKATTICYQAEEAGFVTSTIFQYLLCILVPRLHILMDWFDRLLNDKRISKYLKDLCN